jgi:aconitate hydratase
LTNKVGFKGFGIAEADTKKAVKFNYEGKEYSFKHGTVVIGAITSCTNTSNPDVMLAAGLLAKNAVERGLQTFPYIKKSLSPGSHVVSEYYKVAGVQEALDKLGFTTAGYGCMTCIGNSGEIPDVV